MSIAIPSARRPTRPKERSYAERCPKCRKRYVYLDAHIERCGIKPPDPVKSRKMRERWSDPEARQRIIDGLRESWADPERRQQRREAISDGLTHYWRYGVTTETRAGRPRKRQNTEKALLSLWVSQETYQALIAMTRKRRCSLSEAVRVLIDWGLETEGADT